MPSTASNALLLRQHILFAYRSLKFLPTPYQAEDSNRMTLAYFCLSALGLLPGIAVNSAAAEGSSAVDAMLKPKQKVDFTNWIYRQQQPSGGFRGSDSLAGVEGTVPGQGPPSTSAVPLNLDEEEEFARLMAFDDDPSHDADADGASLEPATVIQSYTALLLLGLLSDDFTRLNGPSLLRFVGRCQSPDGSFRQFPECQEPPDTRSSYAAFVICSVLNDWSSIDLPQALDFLKRCHRLEGGYATRPGLEPHGGATYCCIASFHLASSLSQAPEQDSTIRWLVHQQLAPAPRAPSTDDGDGEDGERHGLESTDPVSINSGAGFAGRPGKACDACYSFWCTAALSLLNPDELLYNVEKDQEWLHSCQHPSYGGIARDPGSPPDVYHTYLSLAALSIGGHPELLKLDEAWNVAQAVADKMRARFHP